MTDIDFLPADFRRRGAARRAPLWRVLVVLGFVALLSGTTLAQYLRWRQARDMLVATEQIHRRTQDEVSQVSRLEAAALAAESQARLLAYLHHPWPRTRILAAVLNPLPDEITLAKLTVSRTLPPKAASAGKSLLLDPKAEEQRLAKMDPAARDLEDLRKIADLGETVVTVSGTTTRPDVLHRYLDQLNRCPLVAKVELDSLETVEKGKAPTDAADAEGPMQFSAMILLRPGYGQPGGPRGRSSADSHAQQSSPAAPGQRPS